MRHLWVVSVVLFGCGASEQSVSDRWDDYVDEHNTCIDANDCAVVYPGCPLGCFTAVSSDNVAEAEAEAERLVRAYERWGRRCDYDCLPNISPTCEAGRCDVQPGSPR